MKNMLKKFGGFVLLLVSSSIYAAVTYTPVDKIKTLNAYAIGNIGVSLIGAGITNPAGCVHTNTYKLYKITDTTEHGKNVFAMALAAKAANNDVTLFIDNDVCASGYAVVTGMISR